MGCGQNGRSSGGGGLVGVAGFSVVSGCRLVGRPPGGGVGGRMRFAVRDWEVRVTPRRVNVMTPSGCKVACHWPSWMEW